MKKPGANIMMVVCVVAIGVAGGYWGTQHYLESGLTVSLTTNQRSNLRISPNLEQKRGTIKSVETVIPHSQEALERELMQARISGNGATLRELAKQLEASAKSFGDLKLVRETFEEAAQLGDTEAKLRAGYYEQRGIGGKADRKDAMHWYESAAADGDMRGNTALARLFIEGGPGTQVDLDRASAYLDLALHDGNVEAMFLKGSLLLGTAKDPTAALAYLSKAAMMNNADAQLVLSRLYAEGKYLPADPALAAEWALAAEQNGSIDAKVDLANYSLNDRSGADTVDSVGDGAKWLFEANDQKNIRASLELATLSLSGGNPSQQDIAFARTNGQAAYEAGTASGAFVVAATYAASSSDDALQWLKKGAAGKDWRSKYALALIRLGDVGVDDAMQAASKASFSDFTTLSLQKNAGSASLTPPAAISTPMPKFPVELRGLSINGTVTAEFTVSNTGTPVGIQILSFSHPQLETAAKEAIANWIFKPAVQNGTTVPIKIRVPIKFRSSGGG